jgi:hypothetical protein
VSSKGNGKIKMKHMKKNIKINPSAGDIVPSSKTELDAIAACSNDDFTDLGPDLTPLSNNDLTNLGQSFVL